jgi:hypothetical protein
MNFRKEETRIAPAHIWGRVQSKPVIVRADRILQQAAALTEDVAQVFAVYAGLDGSVRCVRG